jgi:hypothetical protein
MQAELCDAGIAEEDAILDFRWWAVSTTDVVVAAAKWREFSM